MSIDISEELDTIENEALLNTVRSSVANGAQRISEGAIQADISQELNAIRNGRYGIDIRMAIHDALMKLANSSAPYSNYQAINAYIFEDNHVIDNTIVGDFVQVEFDAE